MCECNIKVNLTKLIQTNYMKHFLIDKILTETEDCGPIRNFEKYKVYDILGNVFDFKGLICFIDSPIR